MPKITAASAALTALIIVSLTGCSNSAEKTPDAQPQGFADVQTETTSPEPLVAEAPTATGAPATGSREEQFAERVKFYLDIDPASNQVPNATAEQLIVAGYAACEKRAAGEKISEFSVIEGETTINDYYWTSSQITSAALETLCPDVPLNDEI